MWRMLTAIAAAGELVSIGFDEAASEWWVRVTDDDHFAATVEGAVSAAFAQWSKTHQ